MTFLNLALGALILVLLLKRQLRPRPVLTDKSWRGALVIGVLGLLQVVQFAQNHEVAPIGWVVLGASLAIGILFGAARAELTRFWREDGVVMRQGTPAGAVLWLVGVVVHIGSDVLGNHLDPAGRGLGVAALTLYLAISLVAQRLHLQRCAEHVPHDPQSAPA